MSTSNDATAGGAEVGAGFSQGADRYDDVLRHNAMGARRLIASIPAGVYTDVLDVGCGTGFAALEMVHRFGCAHVVGLDASEGMLEVFREKAAKVPHLRVDLHVGDVMAIPLPDASVDAVISSMAFHWFPDKAGAVREMARVLRPNGVLAVLASGAGTDKELVGIMRGVEPPLPPAWIAVFDAIWRDVPQMQGLLRDAGLREEDVWMESRSRTTSTEEYLERLRIVGAHLSAGLNPDEALAHGERLAAAITAASGPEGFRYTFNKLFAIARKPA